MNYCLSQIHNTINFFSFSCSSVRVCSSSDLVLKYRWLEIYAFTRITMEVSIQMIDWSIKHSLRRYLTQKVSRLIIVNIFDDFIECWYFFNRRLIHKKESKSYRKPLFFLFKAFGHVFYIFMFGAYVSWWYDVL